MKVIKDIDSFIKDNNITHIFLDIDGVIFHGQFIFSNIGARGNDDVVASLYLYILATNAHIAIGSFYSDARKRRYIHVAKRTPYADGAVL